MTTRTPASKSTKNFEIELNEIYREYLFQVSLHPPENLKAPCHWHWPHAFSSVRKKMKMDRGLASYLIKSDVDSHQIKTSDQKMDMNHDPLLTWSKGQRTKKQKISLITHELSLTGAPKVVADLAQSLKKNGYTVNVISLFEGPMRKEFENHQIPLYILPKKIAMGLLYNPKPFRKDCYRLIASFILLFKLHRVTIGNTYVTGPLIALLSCLNPFYRFIWYIHDSSPPSALLEIKKRMKFLLNLTKCNPRFERWFGSKNTQEIWQNSDLGGKTMYWSGIPANQISFAANSTKPMTEILSVGTSSPRKGTHDLIEAFIMGATKGVIGDDVQLTIIGFYEDVNAPHDYVGDIILKIAHSGLKDRIHLVANLQPHQLEVLLPKS